jgi:hypothetical protein
VIILLPTCTDLGRLVVGDAVSAWESATCVTFTLAHDTEDVYDNHILFVMDDSRYDAHLIQIVSKFILPVVTYTLESLLFLTGLVNSMH